jgi:acyl-CoA dehydrogenase
MAWDFETDPEFKQKLDWIDQFVREECEPLDLLFHANKYAHYETDNPLANAVIWPLQERVKQAGLWACHLTPELGGQGYGQLKLALMNEILGRSIFAPRVFGTQAPDTGNAELIAHFATPEQKAAYLKPLLEGRIVSSFSMTEPQAGADPGEFLCRAVRDGDEYVINGEKWFASNARFAEFLLVVVVTDPEVPIHKGASILVVPRGTPGLEIVRNVGLIGEPIGGGSHGYLRFTDCRVPVSNRIGEEGRGFEAAQVRLGGGRVHHAMRTVAVARKAYDMMRERAVLRRTRGKALGELQMVQESIADSYIQLTQFRLHVLYTAWLIDKEQSYNREVRKEIAAIKVGTARIMHDIVYRAIHLHGSLGTTNELPTAAMWQTVLNQATVDGPTEVHKVAVAKGELRDYPAAPGLFPTTHLLPLIEGARQRYAGLIAEHGEEWLALR